VSLEAAGNDRPRGMIITALRVTGMRNRTRLMIRSDTLNPLQKEGAGRFASGPFFF